MHIKKLTKEIGQVEHNHTAQVLRAALKRYQVAINEDYCITRQGSEALAYEEALVEKLLDSLDVDEFGIIDDDALDVDQG